MVDIWLGGSNNWRRGSRGKPEIKWVHSHGWHIKVGITTGGLIPSLEKLVR